MAPKSTTESDVFQDEPEFVKADMQVVSDAGFVFEILQLVEHDVMLNITDAMAATLRLANAGSITRRTDRIRSEYKNLKIKGTKVISKVKVETPARRRGPKAKVKSEDRATKGKDSKVSKAKPAAKSLSDRVTKPSTANGHSRRRKSARVARQYDDEAIPEDEDAEEWNGIQDNEIEETENVTDSSVFRY